MYISREKIAEARNLDLLTYLRCYDPRELVKLSSRVYTTRSHDSLKISNGKWYWWSRSIGGKSALDYLIVVKGMRFQEAVLHILSMNNKAPVIKASQDQIKKGKEEIDLPKRSKTCENVKRYLNGRGISDEVLNYCIEQGLIYESKNYGNVIFVGCDEAGEIKYASCRACNEGRFMWNCAGSQKEYSFRTGSGIGDTVHVFEGAIDLLSYATLISNDDIDWVKYNLLSVDGVYIQNENGSSTIPRALKQYLEAHKNIKKICLHLDNDEVGRKAARFINDALCNKYDIRLLFPPAGKDYNEYLQIKLGKESEDGKGRNIESDSCKTGRAGHTGRDR